MDSWRSKTVGLTAFCSSPVRRVRLSVKVSDRRKFIVERASWMVLLWGNELLHRYARFLI